jgi:hypothetical protein
MLLMFDQLLKNRVFTGCVHVAVWLLLYLAATQLGGKSPAFQETVVFPNTVEPPPPIAKLETLFAAGDWPGTLQKTNADSPFATAHFIPRNVPAPKPTTRKVALTYQGFFQAGTDVRHAIIRMDDAIVMASIGKQLTTNLFVSDATLQTLTLTNLAAQTNILSLNTKKDVEVPIQ